jgi:hypothetical protein
MAVKKSAARRGRERRGSERADARLSMRVEAGAGAGSPQIVTESQNISSSGIYCLASHYLAPLSKVLLTIVLPRVPGREGAAQELVKLESIVVRCDQRTGDRTETPYELACMFAALEPDMRRRIEEFVTWRNLQALRAALAPAPKARKPLVRRKTSGGARATSTAAARAKRTVRAASTKRAAAKPGRKAASKTGARSAARPARKAARRSAGKARS